MRCVMGVLLALLFAPSAFADDLLWPYGAPAPVPAKTNSWAGFYIGGQVSFSDAGGDFSKTTQDPVAFALRETALENQVAPSSWPVLGKTNHSAVGFGGFAGFNTQFERLVLGVEANYDHAGLSLTAPNSPISRMTAAGGNTYLVNITGSGTMSDLNFGTLRARAGWALGNFLPYAFAGVALGESNVAIAATVSGLQNPPPAGACVAPCVPFSFTGNAGRSSEFMYGFNVGLGVDVALTPNVFLRAEYEYVQFAPVANLIVDVNSVRAGAGFKF
jgi:outer membrane immunogenic protein